MTATRASLLFDTKEKLASLTLEEKIALTAGQDIWRTFASASKGIPYAKLTDGPNGARGGGNFNDSVPAALFPSPSCLASTFDVDLAHEMGKGIALDSRSKQCHVSLAPTVNMTRDQRCGRAFENYGEDPVLTGHIGASWTIGCQSTGVAATPKHFVTNEAEADRRFSNSILDERTLREIYLEPFRIIFKEVAKAHAAGKDGPKGQAFGGQPACIMTAYNQINGTSASECKHTLIDVLRKEWGFNGMVMSDWFALHGCGMGGGCDLEMPGPAFQRRLEIVKEHLQKGECTEQDIDERAIRVLDMLNKVAQLGFEKSPQDEKEESVVDQGREKVIRRIAAEGAVLLKNEADILPLKVDSVKRIALIGKPWTQPIQSGGGSANLTPQQAPKAIDALKAALPSNVELVHHDGCDIHPFPASPVTKTTVEFLSRDNGKTVANSTLEKTALGVLDPKPEECQPNNFIMRVSFDIHASTAGAHTLGLTILGKAHLKAHRQDGSVALDWKVQGETDTFEYLLNEFKTAQQKEISMAAGELVSVVLEYEPQQQDGAIAAMKPAGFTVGFEEEKDHHGLLKDAASVASQCDLALVMTGLGPKWEAEGFDRPNLLLPRLQNNLIAQVAEKQSRTAVITVCGSAVEMPWLDDVAGVLQTWYGGQEAAEALVDCLLARGDAPASGRLCTTWPRSVKDQCTAGESHSFPGVDKTGRGHPDVYYDEGRLVGYKWYEAKGASPLFWFGGGLGGYTTFERELKDVRVEEGQQKIDVGVDVEVKNVGERSGKDVVQVYLAPGKGEEDEPVKKLVAFCTTQLDPQRKAAQLTLNFDEDAFSQWDDKSSQWQVKAGQYVVILASSASPQDEIARKDIEIHQGWTWKGIGRV
ncbi:glycoside hydrolase [Jaminaea rosea]|uniref:beta-glucosidase n=1 Tax=Jaminaea rosea TaxID=1569628 RepID=A0A316UW54_9BASI|nr:glycoside hydrolase [Jaminaea rosea]PWN29530.1 glycoside hydrolase [Jaminaea rosea]